MPDHTLPHDPTSCRLCERVPSDAYGRYWKHELKGSAWHLIADGPNLMARLPRRAHFVTVLAHRPSTHGIPAHYRGPLYWEGDANDPAEALKDLRGCVALLDTEYDCPPETIRLWLSGKRGFHATMPPIVMGAEEGHPQLPLIYKAIIQRLFPPHVAPTLDRGIYNAGRGRMWRLPNHLRADTNRYKVPLSMKEVLHKSYAELEALTHRPRKGIFWPPEAELSPCPG
jgi:hypothetical protein